MKTIKDYSPLSSEADSHPVRIQKLTLALELSLLCPTFLHVLWCYSGMLWQQDRQSNFYRNIVVTHHNSLITWIPQDVHQVFLLKFSSFPAASRAVPTFAQNTLCMLWKKQLPGSKLCFLAFFKALPVCVSVSDKVKEMRSYDPWFFHCRGVVRK